MTHQEATVLANFLDKVLPGTEYRQVMVAAPPSREDDWGVTVADEDDNHNITRLWECKTFEDVYDYMKVKTAMRVSWS